MGQTTSCANNTSFVQSDHKVKPVKKLININLKITNLMKTIYFQIILRLYLRSTIKTTIKFKKFKSNISYPEYIRFIEWLILLRACVNVTIETEVTKHVNLLTFTNIYTSYLKTVDTIGNCQRPVCYFMHMLGYTK